VRAGPPCPATAVADFIEPLVGWGRGGSSVRRTRDASEASSGRCSGPVRSPALAACEEPFWRRMGGPSARLHTAPHAGAHLASTPAGTRPTRSPRQRRRHGGARCSPSVGCGCGGRSSRASAAGGRSAPTRLASTSSFAIAVQRRLRILLHAGGVTWSATRPPGPASEPALPNEPEAPHPRVSTARRPPTPWWKAGPLRGLPRHRTHGKHN
jgi:hypothetical protein